MAEDKNTWGGVREGAGRPVGWRKEGGTRKQRQLRAYDEEWELIKQFAKLVKDDVEKAKSVLKAY